ncbi:hypothetical protein ACFQ3Z_01405 [Streptomyces nogalater]
MTVPGVISGALTAAVGDRIDPPRASNASSGHVHIEERTPASCGPEWLKCCAVSGWK